MLSLRSGLDKLEMTVVCHFDWNGMKWSGMEKSLFNVSVY